MFMCDQPPKLTIKMPATQVEADSDRDTDEIDKEVDQNEDEVDADTEPIDLQHTFVEAPDSSKSEYGFLKVVSGKTSTLLKKSTIDHNDVSNARKSFAAVASKQIGQCISAKIMTSN